MGSCRTFGFIKSSVTILRRSSNLYEDILNIRKKVHDLLTLSLSLIDRKISW